MKKTLIQSPNQIQWACSWLAHWLSRGLEDGKPVSVKLAHESRSEAQNRHLWPLLQCLATQKEYGGQKRSKEEWKIIMISAYKFEPQGIVIGLNGELVNLNYSTSELTKAQFSEFIEMIYAQGCEWGIQWSDPALKSYEEWGIK